MDILQDSVSNSYHKRLQNLIETAETLSGDPVEVATLIHQYQEGIKADPSLTEEEKYEFLILLSVFRSSNELWTAFEKKMGENSKNGMVQGIPEKYAWKIPVADWIGGITGGLASGPAAPLGALLGLAGSSLTMAVGIWEYKVPDQPKIITSKDIKTITPRSNGPVYYNFQ